MSDLAFKPEHCRCRNLVEREIDSVSSCAINLDCDFNVEKATRQHRFAEGKREISSRDAFVETKRTTRRQMDEIAAMALVFLSRLIVFADFNIESRSDVSGEGARKRARRR